jgi:hypothetical protein
MAMQEIVSYQAANLEDIAARLEDEAKGFRSQKHRVCERQS